MGQPFNWPRTTRTWGGEGIREGPWLKSIVLILQIKPFYIILPEFADDHVGFEVMK